MAMENLRSKQVDLAARQLLYDGTNDPLLVAALEEFFAEQARIRTNELLHAVRQHVRDTMKEARLAGMVEAYESALEDLRRYAEKKLRDGE
jgi:hypothetical protein